MDFEALEELIQKEEKESKDHVSRSNGDKRSQKSFREDNHKVVSSSRSPRSQNLSENERHHSRRNRNDEKYYNRERTQSKPRHRSDSSEKQRHHSKERSPRDKCYRHDHRLDHRDSRSRDYRDHREYDRTRRDHQPSRESK